jgi:hypothetical protein
MSTTFKTPPIRFRPFPAGGKRGIYPQKILSFAINLLIIAAIQNPRFINGVLYEG